MTGSQSAPEITAEADDEVDATRRHGWLAQLLQRCGDQSHVDVRPQVELDEGVRDRALGKDAELGNDHRPSSYAVP